MRNKIRSIFLADNGTRTSWVLKISTMAVALALLMVLTLVLVYLGVLPDGLNGRICSLFTSYTRGQLGGACN